MFSNTYLLVFITSVTLAPVRSGRIGIIANLLDSDYKPIKNLERNFYYFEEEQSKKVDIKVYYESFCVSCQFFDSFELRATVDKLGPYLDIHLYPYGNANMTTNENGELSFDCQHGPGECYGNMLHACAIDYLQNMTKAVFFNSCMMDFFQQGKGSDDTAADWCGKDMNIDTKEIKTCAKGPKGKTLLKYYGEESKKAGFEHVPYILVNGKESDIFNFIFDVCGAFDVPPPICMPK